MRASEEATAFVNTDIKVFFQYSWNTDIWHWTPSCELLRNKVSTKSILSRGTDYKTFSP